MNWIEPIPEEPPHRQPRNGKGRGKVGLLQRLAPLIAAPDVWHKVGFGGVNARATVISQGRGLIGRWEAVSRGDTLYVRFLGFDDEGEDK